MKRKYYLFILPFAIIFIFTAEMWSDNGRAGYTGSSGETTCTNCHSSYALNSGGGSLNLRTDMNNWQYELGQTYNMELMVARSGNHLFGMGLEALDASLGNAGTLLITDAAHTQIKSKIVNSVSRRNVVHTLNGGSNPDSMLFTFQWTAPLTNIGDVTFYYCGLAANAANNEAGDYVYHAQQTTSLMISSSISENSIEAKVLSLQNPVQDQLTIRYLVEKSGPVSIELYSISGQLVQPLVSGDKVAGKYSDHISGLSRYARGIYIVKYTQNDKLYSEKIVLD